MASDKKKPGDRCDCGNGHMRIRTSKSLGEFQLRYLQCPRCGSGCRCVVRADQVRRRCNYNG